MTWLDNFIQYLNGMFGNQFFTGAFLLGALTTIFLALKKVPIFIWTRIKRKLTYSVHIDETDELYLYFERWLKRYYSEQYRNVTASLSEVTAFSRQHHGLLDEVCESRENKSLDDMPKKDNVHFHQFEDLLIIKYKGRWMRVSKGRDKLEQAKDLFSAFYNHFTISSLFGRKIINTLIDEVVDYNYQFKPNVQKRIQVYVNQYTDWNRVRSMEPKNIHNIVMHADSKERLITDITEFKTNRKWYEERAIPYKRGYCFYGPPGNGKTSLSLALARQFNCDVHMMNLNTVDDSHIRSLFNWIGPNSILLLEDVDATFSGRNSSNDKLTFSTFLQCLDGALYSDGLITIMTTNHVEKLDPALIRDGRVDVRMEIGNPDYGLICEYVNKYYGSDVGVNGMAGHVPGISMSRVQNICLANKYPDGALETITSETEKILER